MTLALSFETENPFDFDAESLIRQVAEAVLDSENCPYACSLNLLLTDDVSMREINRSERGLDASTDVLSFPFIFFPAPADYSALENDPMNFDPDSGELLLGDMVISLDKLFAQARAYGHSPRRELAFLVAHSMFHLLGYDHEEDAERRIMEEKQEAVLQRLGITREKEGG